MHFVFLRQISGYVTCLDSGQVYGHNIFLLVAEFKYTVFSWNAALPCLQEWKIFLGSLSLLGMEALGYTKHVCMLGWRRASQLPVRDAYRNMERQQSS